MVKFVSSRACRTDNKKNWLYIWLNVMEIYWRMEIARSFNYSFNIAEMVSDRVYIMLCATVASMYAPALYFQTSVFGVRTLTTFRFLLTHWHR